MEVIGCKKQNKQLRSEAVFENIKGRNPGTCRNSPSETSQKFMYISSELRAHMDPTYAITTSLWGKGSGSGKRENAHLRGIEPSKLRSDSIPIGQ